jgi:ComF family protein
MEKVQRIGGAVCDVCGTPQSKTTLCSSCELKRPEYNALRSWSLYEDPVREALLRLKYRNDIGLGDTLASCMVSSLANFDWPIDVVAPVPLGRGRLRARGYNQAGLIARPLALALGLAYDPGVLKRVRETRTQVGLTPLQRSENVRGAFAGVPARAHGRSVLVVDDIATTGSTLSACAGALLSAGAKVVYGLTAARALPHQTVDDA